jgi:hypothetical protein
MDNFLAILLIVVAGVGIKYYLDTADAKSAAPKPVPSSVPVVARAAAAGNTGAVNAKARHVAAITAAILASTGGRGRILSIAPQPGPAAISSAATGRWRTAGIVASVGRTIAPSWKR